MSEQILNYILNLWKKEYPLQFRGRLKGYHWKEDTISISDIKVGTPRNKIKAQKYLKLIKEGVDFPPVIVLARGNSHPYKFLLLDGFHRIWAYKQLGIENVHAYIGDYYSN